MMREILTKIHHKYFFILGRKHLLNVKNYKYGDEAKCCFANIAFAPPDTRKQLNKHVNWVQRVTFWKINKTRYVSRFP